MMDMNLRKNINTIIDEMVAKKIPEAIISYKISTKYGLSTCFVKKRIRQLEELESALGSPEYAAAMKEAEILANKAEEASDEADEVPKMPVEVIPEVEESDFNKLFKESVKDDSESEQE